MLNFILDHLVRFLTGAADSRRTDRQTDIVTDSRQTDSRQTDSRKTDSIQIVCSPSSLTTWCDQYSRCRQQTDR
jgi:hypothetical protein